MVLRRVCGAKLQRDGLLKPKRALDTEQEYFVCTDTEIPALRLFSSKQQVVDWIWGAVLGDLRTFREGILHRNTGGFPIEPEQPLGGGNFLLAGCGFMALDYLGQVYGRGDNSTERAKTYARDFLARINERYVELFEIIWLSFRHGIIHGSWPQAVAADSDPRDSLTMGVSISLEGPHLGTGSRDGQTWLVLSSVQLVRDLELSVESGFRSWVLDHSDNGVLERAAPRLSLIRTNNDIALTQLAELKKGRYAV